MKTSGIKVAFLVILCAVVAFEVWHFRGASEPTRQASKPAAKKNGPDFALLPATEIQPWAKYLAAGAHPESWEPTVGDMNDVEANLAQITGLSNSDPDVYRHIDDPRAYYRQYLAVVIDGKKRVYVNALCSVDQDPNWRKHLVVVLDGGKCYWHATFDSSTQKFSDLVINGRA